MLQRNRMKNCNRILGLIIILSLFVLPTKGQVTIGSSETPEQGAILDLKENPDGTSTRGLGMPRIELTNLYNLTDVGVVDPSLDATHTGLVVYNTVDKNDYRDPICKGLYVWDGEKWQALNPVVRKPDITMTDGEGNIYPAKWFGPPCDLNQGAYWTTENLYSILQADGSPLPDNIAPGGTVLPGARINPGFYRKSNLTDAEKANVTITTSVSTLTGTVSYDAGNSASTITTITMPRGEFAKKFGLLYSRNQSLVLCPSQDGWEVPKREEWIELRDYFQATGSYLRTNDTHYLANDLKGDASKIKHWGGNDTMPANTSFSEFNALPSGSVTSSYTLADFGEEADWRSITQYTSQDDGAVLKYADTGLSTTGRGGVINYYFAVRCIKR